LDEEGLAALDKNDPNYDSEEDRAVVYQSKQASWVRQEVEAYKQEVRWGLGFKVKVWGWV
jgi:hypothetical protein